tara:strand:+ start:657 stop:917 length:261 start_codon:yes stop_codon:yes gene_type:complete
MVVSHVLGSACAVAYNPGTRADEWEPFARLVLEASYEACVLAALDNRDRHDGMAGSKKLFLTLLGAAATLSATRRRGSWMRISGER